MHVEDKSIFRNTLLTHQVVDELVARRTGPDGAIVHVERSSVVYHDLNGRLREPSVDGLPITALCDPRPVADLLRDSMTDAMRDLVMHPPRGKIAVIVLIHDRARIGLVSERLS